MTGWIIALTVIILIAVIPLGITAAYQDGQPLVKVFAGPVRITLLPKKEKADKKKKKEKHAADSKNGTAESKKKSSASPEKAKKKISLNQIKMLLGLALKLLDDLRKKIRVTELKFHLILSGEDPADVALNYGRVWELMGNLWPRAEHAFSIKKQDIKIACDFEAEKTKAEAKITVNLLFGRLVVLAVRYGFRLLKEMLRLKQEKAVRVNEPEHS